MRAQYKYFLARPQSSAEQPGDNHAAVQAVLAGRLPPSERWGLMYLKAREQLASSPHPPASFRELQHVERPVRRWFGLRGRSKITITVPPGAARS
jgi:hypothetical protein